MRPRKRQEETQTGRGRGFGEDGGERGAEAIAPASGPARGWVCGDRVVAEQAGGSANEDREAAETIRVGCAERDGCERDASRQTGGDG